MKPRPLVESKTLEEAVQSFLHSGRDRLRPATLAQYQSLLRTHVVPRWGQLSVDRIYVLLVVQTGSFFLRLILMLAIPLTLLGILPGFWLLNLFLGGNVGGYDTSVLFTATSMVGMIALGGIVIRNSVVLLDFVQNARRSGMDAREATLAGGAVRMRPILLTAATTGLAVWPITFDPIFSGLAWALIFGGLDAVQPRARAGDLLRLLRPRLNGLTGDSQGKPTIPNRPRRNRWAPASCSVEPSHRGVTVEPAIVDRGRDVEQPQRAAVSSARVFRESGRDEDQAIETGRIDCAPDAGAGALFERRSRE